MQSAKKEKNMQARAAKQEKNMHTVAEIAERVKTLIESQEANAGGQISRSHLIRALTEEKFMNELLGIIINDKRTVKDPEAPKKPSSAYILFTAEQRAKAKEKDPEAKLQTMELAAKWNEIKDTKKAEKYKRMAEEDKARYEEEMKDYTPPPLSTLLELPVNKPKAHRTRKPGSTPKKAKKPADHPKSARNAWIFFQAEKRPEVKEQEDDSKEVSRILGKMWKELPEDEKKPYEKMAKKDKKRYEEEMKAWEDAHPEPEDMDDDEESEPKSTPKTKKPEAEPESSDDSEDDAPKAAAAHKPVTRSQTKKAEK